MRAVIVSKGWLTLQGDVGHFLGFRDPIHHTPDFFKCMVQSTFFLFSYFLMWVAVLVLAWFNRGFCAGGNTPCQQPPARCG